MQGKEEVVESPQNHAMRYVGPVEACQYYREPQTGGERSDVECLYVLPFEYVGELVSAPDELIACPVLVQHEGNHH